MMMLSVFVLGLSLSRLSVRLSGWLTLWVGVQKRVCDRLITLPCRLRTVPKREEGEGGRSRLLEGMMLVTRYLR